MRFGVKCRVRTTGNFKSKTDCASQRESRTKPETLPFISLSKSSLNRSKIPLRLNFVWRLWWLFFFSTGVKHTTTECWRRNLRHRQDSIPLQKTLLWLMWNKIFFFSFQKKLHKAFKIFWKETKDSNHVYDCCDKYEIIYINQCHKAL